MYVMDARARDRHTSVRLSKQLISEFGLRTFYPHIARTDG
jgi:hypothetical protein